MIQNSKRVLLVEDNADNRYLATLLFEAEGYEVTAVVNGADALAAIAEDDNIALVLLDLQLPDIDGFEIARRIHRRASTAQLPIIAVSAFAQAKDRRRAFAAGCAGYIEKPINADSFVAQVRCLVGDMGTP